MGRKINKPLITSIAILFTAFICSVCAYTAYKEIVRPYCKDCNVILISLDTLSANHLPCYGYNRDTAPHLCKFAKENIQFTNMFSNANFTLPSHVSIFTGLYPSQHKVNVPNVDRLSPSVPFLPEILQRDGYKTYFYIPLQDSSHLPVDKVFYRGIDKITSAFHPHDWNSGLEILKKNNESHQKTFLFLHTYWVHSPYILEDENRKLYTADDTDTGELPTSYKSLNSCTPQFMDFFRKALKEDVESNYWDGQKRKIYSDIYKKLVQSHSSSNEMSVFPCDHELYRGYLPYYFRAYYINIIDQKDPKQISYIRDSYDSKIKELDEYLQEVFQKVLKTKLKDNTIIIITADHGEEFMEHGEVGHGKNLYDTSLRIPLIMYVPKQTGKTITQISQSVDIMPTLLHLVGVTNANRSSGSDLFVPTDKVAYAEHLPLNSQALNQRSIRHGDWKLIMKSTDIDSTPYELYNISQDHSEKNNLIFKEPKKIDELLRLVPIK